MIIRLCIHLCALLLQVKGSLEASVLCLTTIGIMKLNLRLMDDVKVCTLCVPDDTTHYNCMYMYVCWSMTTRCDQQQTGRMDINIIDCKTFHCGV